MPYQIDRFNGTPLVTVDDGTIDQFTDLKLVGKNYAGYGEIQNENFVFLLENFSNTVAPPKPLSGQIWFDSATKKLKFYDNSKWRTTGGAEISATAPTGLTIGDFWWNTSTKQLYSWDGSAYVLVGPLAVSGAGQTTFEAVSVLGTDLAQHPIIKAIANGITTFIISSDAYFNLDPTEKAKPQYAGFDRINPGITLVDSNSGKTTSSFRYWGTASDSEKLGGTDAANYVLASGAIFTNASSVASFPDSGFTVGADNDLKVFIDGGTSATIQNQITNKISFKILDGITTKETMRIEGSAVVPGLNITYDLGTPTLRWRQVRAEEGFFDTVTAGAFIGPISGTASRADTLRYGIGNYVSATDSAINNTIVARDVSGNFSANVINATATRARYADLAEKYVADLEYDPGTVLVFGGDKEVTITTVEGDHRVAGVVSTDPAYLMNAEEEGIAVALRGKVPVKVVGKVAKGDILITSTTAGYAISAGSGENISSSSIVAKALENKESEDLGIIMAVVV